MASCKSVGNGKRGKGIHTGYPIESITVASLVEPVCCLKYLSHMLFLIGVHIKAYNVYVNAMLM